MKDAVETSPELAEHISEFVQSDLVATYLEDHHDLDPHQIRSWVDETLENIHRNEVLSAAVEVKRNRSTFVSVSDRIGRFPLFKDLPAEELQEVSKIIICKHHRKGETLFHQNEAANRLYIVEHGRVALFDPSQPTRRLVDIGDNDMFGGFSFLTGARHTVSALVDADTDVGVIRKRDFDTLLSRCPTLGEHVRRDLQSDRVEKYLETRHAFDPNRATQWTRKAIKSLDTGGLIPSAAEMASEVKTHAGAPMAIWLGILLDGIPESLVIGASVVHGGTVSYSLIAETMMPEAYLKGGSVVGLSTLAGFLVAIFFTTLH